MRVPSGSSYTYMRSACAVPLAARNANRPATMRHFPDTGWMDIPYPLMRQIFLPCFGCTYHAILVHAGKARKLLNSCFLPIPGTEARNFMPKHQRTASRIMRQPADRLTDRSRLGEWPLYSRGPMGGKTGQPNGVTPISCAGTVSQ